ncbi:MAG TPA: DUF5655 domain-containing protein [Candidatus Dormibacteraeota bacterium]|nr:DUF5655 domain-containing protein [Candidatus Dormibacteraeota bacterium]
MFQIVSCEPIRAMWTRPDCGRSFANRNQSHFCSQVRLDEHFEGREPNVVATFEGLIAAPRKSGPVTVLPEKTRIAFQVRMSFAAFTLRRLERPRFRRIDFISPRNQVQVFRLHEPTDVDAEVEGWLAEAYSVGRQEHFSAKRR